MQEAGDWKQEAGIGQRTEDARRRMRERRASGGLLLTAVTREQISRAIVIQEQQNAQGGRRIHGDGTTLPLPLLLSHASRPRRPVPTLGGSGCGGSVTVEVGYLCYS